MGRKTCRIDERMQQAWLIGSGEGCDIRVDSPVVSRRHCRLTLAAAGWILEDLGSTNGTFVNGVRRTGPVPISRGDVVTLGISQPLPWPRDPQPPSGGEPTLPTLALPGRGRTLVVGRSTECNVVVDYPMVSGRHAEIARSAAGWTVRDLGSTNGTYLDGRRIAGSTEVRPGGVLGLGSHRLALVAPDTPPQGGDSSGVAIEVRDLAVGVVGRTLIEAVTLVVRPGELVGVMGPSGAGKSTLLATIAGCQRPTGGHVTVGGVDVAARFEELRGRIGFVPQDDIMHAELTVGQALWYSARLRLPRDYSDAEIRGRVATVLGQLGLTDVEHARIGTPERRGISGGQRKRVNVALELITDPPVLLLDEPTSGLSSVDAVALMRLLRGLADEGKTIVLTIHQPGIESLRMMDALALIARDRSSGDVGRLAWFGPALPDAAAFFEPANPRPDADAVLRGLASRPVAEWCAAFDNSPARKVWIDERLSAGLATSSVRRPRPRSLLDFLSQWGVLVRRMLAVKAADRWSTGVLLAQAPLIAVLVAAVFGGRASVPLDHGSWAGVAQAIATTTFLMALAAIWFGCSNAAREIVAERAIYRRERMVGLSLYAYLTAKLVVMFGLVVVQCAILQAVVSRACHLVAAPGRSFTILLLAAMAAVTIGLCVSALVRSAEAASGVLPLVILPMVILGGILLPLPDLPRPAVLLADALPSRWAFEGLFVPEAEGRPEIEVPAAGEPGAVGESRVVDLAAAWFPEGGWRSGPDTPGWMLALMVLLGLASLRTIMVRSDVGGH